MTKNCEQCGNEFEAKKFAPQHKFCSDQCRRKNRNQRIKEALNGRPGTPPAAAAPAQPSLFEVPVKPIEPVATAKAPTPMKKEVKDDEPVIARRSPIPVPSGLDSTSSFIFSLQNREIDRFEDLYKEERKKRKQLKDEAEKLRTELAELKTENKIKAIEDEHKKPTGLSGITSGLSSLLENPHIGPHIGQFIGNMLSGGVAQLQGPAVDDPEAQQAAVDILNWFALQEKSTQKAFSGLMHLIAGVQDPAQLPDLIERLTYVIKGGSTIQRADANAGMSYGT